MIFPQKLFGIYIKVIKYKNKIGERNGEGKEYKRSTNKLIFEGKYLNNKKNGKGKDYYYNGELKFEGDYIKGKKWKRKRI